MSTSASVKDEHIIGGNLKRAKFDRQLRLWGADGQAALEAAHVVALGATPAIAEALKSLILTGVPAITLVDERVATAEDAASNYFVAASSAGTSLATAVLKNVCALGEQCSGVAATVTPAAWAEAYAEAVESDWRAGCVYTALAPSDNCSSSSSSEKAAACASLPSSTAGVSEASALRKFMKSFIPVVGSHAAPHTAAWHLSGAAPSLILVSERYPDLSATSLLVQTCVKRTFPSVPVMLVRSSGMLGFVQVYSPPRVILRPHNPTQVKMEDLRIFEPFPALQRWFDAHNPDDDTQFSAADVDAMSLHSHLPYPCILHHAFRRWWASLSSEEQRALQHCPSLSSSSSSSSPSIFPLSPKEYREVANCVAAMIRRHAPPEEAFMEAMERCTAKLNRPVVLQLPQGLNALFQDPRCADPQLAVAELHARLFPASPSLSPSSAFSAQLRMLMWTSPEVLVWFVLRAVQLFIEGDIGREETEMQHQTLPSSSPTANSRSEQHESTKAVREEVSGRAPMNVSRYRMPFSGYLPDFTTTTMWYRELQDIYNAKHLADVTCIADKAWELVMHAVLHGEEEHTAGACAIETPTREQQLSSVVKPLLVEYTTSLVANIWDVRGVVFSPHYDATQEAEWCQQLGRRLTWIMHSIAYDVAWNASTRRAACLAVAFLCKEELQRCAAARQNSDGDSEKDGAPRTVTGQEIAREVVYLVSLANTAAFEPRINGNEGEDGKAAAAESAQSFPAWLLEDGSSQKLLSMACEEVARWAGRDSAGGCVQLPSVAASTGALAAQEAVKLIMRIRVPCGQPIMYDGYTNKTYNL